MKLPRNAKIFRGQLDAAPMAAVLLLLLIFLALNSRLVFNPGVKIDLPVVRDGLPGTRNRTVIVAIDAAGQLYYESQVVTNQENLLLRLKGVVERSPNDPVTLEIQADKSGKVQDAINLMSLAGEIGFQKVLMVGRPVTRPIPPDKSPSR